MPSVAFCSRSLTQSQPNFEAYTLCPKNRQVCCLSGLLQGSIKILVTHNAAPPHAVVVVAVVAVVAAVIAVGVLLLLWMQVGNADT